MKKEVFERRKWILGEYHPDTISAMGELADVLHQLGRWHEAFSMKEEVLKKLVRILGEDHPDTIRALAYLAVMVSELGKADEALSMEKEVFERRKRVLGEDHPDTITALANLAVTVSELGKADEALSMKKEVFERRKRVLGEQHPDTVDAKENLEASRAGAYEMDEATTVCERLSKFGQKTALGNVHQDSDDSLLECPGWNKQLHMLLSQPMTATGHSAEQPEDSGVSESAGDHSEYDDSLDDNESHQEESCTCIIL
jgi:tetratricopeptide (TPR) repeat protein